MLVLSFLVGAQPVAAGVIRGQVVDAHGNPVSDAAVHVMSAGGEAWTTRTAPSGRFFVSLPPGSYRVVVSSTDGATDHDEVVVHHDSLEGVPDEVVVELATTATPSPATDGVALVVGGARSATADQGVAKHEGDHRTTAGASVGSV